MTKAIFFFTAFFITSGCASNGSIFYPSEDQVLARKLFPGSVELDCPMDPKTKAHLEPCDKTECYRAADGRTACQTTSGHKISDNQNSIQPHPSPGDMPASPSIDLSAEKEECNQRHSKGCIAVIEHLTKTRASKDELQVWIDKVCSFKHVRCKRDGEVFPVGRRDFSSKTQKSVYTSSQLVDSKVSTLEIAVFR